MSWFLTSEAREAVYRWMTGALHRRQWAEWFEFCRRAAAVTGKDR